MGARVETTYDREFVLGEENIIRLTDIINSRLPANSGAKINYRVYRRDDFYVDYETPQEVISEENARHNLVTELTISVEGTADMATRLTFRKKGKSLLQIESTDRDIAFLLASEVKEYIKSEVLLSRLRLSGVLSSEAFTDILLAIAAVLMPVILLQVLISGPGPVPESVISSPDITDKLNYMLRSSERNQFFGTLGYLMVVVFFAIALVTVLRQQRDWFATRVFYWGRQMQRFDRYLGAKEKILWGIIISLIVGVIAGLATGKIQQVFG
jgi:hypothetical protein